MGNYERLENGMGPNRVQKHFGWKKFAIAACCIIGLVWFFGPREPRDLGWGKKDPSERQTDGTLGQAVS
jgi:guanosine-diphosphatase